MSCKDEFLNRGSDTVTCTEDTTFTSDVPPACAAEKIGEYESSSCLILSIQFQSEINNSDSSQALKMAK